MLSIPGSSCECERLFSELGDLLEPRRHSISPQLLAAIQCDRRWIRAGFGTGEVPVKEAISDEEMDAKYANPSEPSELLASAQLAEQANWLSSLSLLIDICVCASHAHPPWLPRRLSTAIYNAGPPQVRAHTSALCYRLQCPSTVYSARLPFTVPVYRLQCPSTVYSARLPFTVPVYRLQCPSTADSPACSKHTDSTYNGLQRRSSVSAHVLLTTLVHRKHTFPNDYDVTHPYIINTIFVHYALLSLIFSLQEAIQMDTVKRVGRVYHWLFDYYMAIYRRARAIKYPTCHIAFTLAELTIGGETATELVLEFADNVPVATCVIV
ncbi:hypothetical protein PtrM4_105190 [Pyrenophora tritici-repentis]|uniref:HAT C-terminal dimerisation domain-containing protein n=1 Tax=Pyrenophora tritici-repentis TaxID=45151 RepID=A0A834VQM8_9PLEO|nr:hypothetical protein PtrM4_105190 [Pyrenophora tritici-repentis]